MHSKMDHYFGLSPESLLSCLRCQETKGSHMESQIPKQLGIQSVWAAVAFDDNPLSLHMSGIGVYLHV